MPASAPEAIFLAGSSWTNAPRAVVTGFDADAAATRARMRAFLDRPGWSGLPAVRAGKVYAIEHGLCRSLFDYAALAFVAKQLHPERFRDVDPVAELRRYHEACERVEARRAAA